MKARIGMISQWYDPERGSAALPGIIAQSLTRRGHHIEVVTGFPNYPTGNLYPGYSFRPYQRETINGITVHRAPLYPSHDSRPIRRATNFLSFAGTASGVALKELASADVVLVFYSPATTAIPALALKALRKKPFVIHIQDMWPQSVVASGFLNTSTASRVERLLNTYCDAVYRRADAIAVTAPGMANLVESRGISTDKITIVPNWADESAFRPLTRDPKLAAELGITRPFTVMYAGNFGEYQALDVLLEAAARLRERPDIGFALVGGGVEEARLRAQVVERRLDNVTFLTPQPFERMAPILALGDVQLISLKDLPLFRTILPSKLQATLASGRPIIGAVTGDAANVVRDAGAGLLVTPGSVDDLVDAIKELRNLPSDKLNGRGAAGREYYLRNFSEAVAGDRLSSLLESAAAGHGSARE